MDGELQEHGNFKKLERFKEHTIDAVIGQADKKLTEAALRPLVEQALKMGKGTLKLRLADKSIPHHEHRDELPLMRLVL